MHTDIRIPNEAVSYILFQRTAYLKIIHSLPYRALKRMTSASLYKPAVFLEARLRKNAIKEIYLEDMRKEYESIKYSFPGEITSVLDIGCGAGRALMALAGVFPQSRFRGYDLCDEAVRMARSEAEKRGLKNIHFEVRDVVNLREESRYDFIMALDSIHDQARPGQVLLEIQKALRPEGTFLMQDIAASSHVHKNMDHPIGPLLYTVSCMHCMTVSLARGGDGLGAVWGRETAERMVKEAGFGSGEVKKLPHDIQNFLYVIRK